MGPLLILSLFDDAVLCLGAMVKSAPPCTSIVPPGNWTGSGCGARAALPIPRLPSALLRPHPYSRAGASCRRSAWLLSLYVASGQTVTTIRPKCPDARAIPSSIANQLFRWPGLNGGQRDELIPLWHPGVTHHLLARSCARRCTCRCNVEFNPVNDSRFPVTSEVSGSVSQSKIKFYSHLMILIKAQRTLALESTRKREKEAKLALAAVLTAPCTRSFNPGSGAGN